MGNEGDEEWSTLMHVCDKERKQTNNAVYFAYTDNTLHASFTLLFVFIPSSISKTWLKCSSYRRLCWTMKTKKQAVRWEEKWRRKVKSIFYGVTLFILHRRWEEKHTDIQTFPSSPSPSLPFSSAVPPSPNTWGQPQCIVSSIASPEQRFSHTFITKHWYNSQCSL